MALYKDDFVRIDLADGSIFRSFMNRTLGEGDIDATRFGVIMTRSGEAEDLTGVSCSGYFVRADGQTVVITGTVEDNKAFVTIPQSACAVEGNFSLAIKLVGSGVTGTMRIVDGTVSSTTTETIVDPGQVIPSIAELLAQIEACENATDAANAAAASSLGNFAPAFAQGTANAAGTYVTYTDGKVYLLPEGHTANTTWANTTKTAVTIGGEVSDLKSALDDTLITASADWSRGGISSSDGTATSSTTRCRTTVIPDNVVEVQCASGYKFAVYAYNGSTYVGIWNGSSFAKSASWRTGSQILSGLGNYSYRLVFAKSDDSTVTVDDATNITLLASFQDATMMKRSGLSNSDDLNSVIHLGIYQCSTGNLPSNVPVSSGGMLIVSEINSIVEQLYFTTGAQYFRFRGSGGTWQSWKTVNTDETPTIIPHVNYVRCANFSAFCYSGQTVIVAFDALSIKYSDNTTFTQTDPASYTITGAHPILAVKNGSVQLLDTMSEVSKTTTVLLYYNSSDGDINSGLLFPLYNEYRLNNEYEDDARLNIAKKVIQLGKIKWTPKADVRSGEGLNEAGVEVTGIPYTSPKEYEKFVGLDVSIHTFMTAVNDIHSLMYTEKIGEGESASAYGITYHGVNCTCYFGTVCSGLTSTATGLKTGVSSWDYITDHELFEELKNQDVRNLVVGDVLSEPGHCSIITKVARFPDGSMRTLELDEHLAPIRFKNYNIRDLNDRTAFQEGVWCRVKDLSGNTDYKASPFILVNSEWLYNQGDLVFIDGDNSRTFYRCKTANSDSSFTASKWDAMPVYTPGTEYNHLVVRFVQYGDDLYQCIKDHTAGSTFDPDNWVRIRGVFEWASYPFTYNDDIVTFAGDRATFHDNDLIYINYTKGSYTQMELYKDGTLIKTIDLPESGYQINVSSDCSGAGMYKARLKNGSTYSRYTYFEVINTQVTATYSNGSVTISFSSTNGTPLVAQVVEQSGYPISRLRVTDKEIASGSVVINPPAKLYSERYWYMERFENYNSNIYARVIFAGEYGNTVNPMILLGEMTPISGELVYPDTPVDFGTIAVQKNIILTSRMQDNTYTFSFTAGSGADVSVLPAVGTIKWKNTLPASLVNGTTYLVGVENGIGDVVSVT